MIFLSDLHTLNWSSTNIVAAALGSEVYLWNANNSSITLLMTAEQEQYVSGISWITDGSILGVGLSGGSVQVGCSLRPVCKPLDSESFIQNLLLWKPFYELYAFLPYSQLWDVNKVKLVRTMTGHSARVGCLDWNAHILTR